ncbi:two-component system response regulator YesN [Paenibacillus sp. V4I3]|uniref:helix-turn-helix domain-containing protein n=1 Tax=Paenibacillus sp. V4I3 TaxID=3042305 RepID=UPI00277EC33B|nr:helix-turn-helix domain-containing protein [Paenibacillus sp. V4I3]MDQ0877787.1 two-component system response regulator YesN [Paenibacillus sp. V4I3]
MNTFSRKFLLIYMPIFLLTVTVLIFMSFLIVNDISRSETSKANRISTSYIVDTVDRTMSEMEMKVLQELELENSYNDFLYPSTDARSNERYYDVVNNMNTLINNYSLIDSIYIYRKQGDSVLTQSGLVELNAFADANFLRQRLKEPESRGWSKVRKYPEANTQSQVPVFSLSRSLPIPFGQDGMMVINISKYRLERMINGLLSGNVSYLDVYDESGNQVFEFLGSGYLKKDKVLTTIHSKHLNWTFQSGIQAGQLFSWVSLISYIWIVIGIITIIGAMVFIFYMTRRNYRPITKMMNRLQFLQLPITDAKLTLKDDLTVISYALDNLIEQTTDYEKERRNNEHVLRRQLFRGLIEGERMEDLSERIERMRPFAGDAKPKGFTVFIVELNRYGQFQQNFSLSDQNILKYAVMNVLNEIINDYHMSGWFEWISSDKLGTIVSMKEDIPDKTVLRAVGEKCHSWINEHLRISLTMGIGSVVTEPAEIYLSYQAADSALRHKLSLGQEAVVMSEELPEQSHFHSYQYFQSMSQFVREFRLAGDGWRLRLDAIFQSFVNDNLRNEEIHLQLETLMKILEREVGELSDTLANRFKGQQWDEMWTSVVQASSLHEVQKIVSDWLTELFQTYVSVNESKSYRALIEEIKKYIENNYANPDLSLKHLSDQFQISGKYASYLFKEEFNTKFVDFLVHLRMNRAESLLENTNDTIQDIAMNVGYANAITFGRVFKKVVGVTPGDFRKLKNTEKK